MRIVFFCDKLFSWDCLASIHDAFRRTSDVEMSVLTSSKTVSDFLHSRNVPTKGWDDYARIESEIQNADFVFTAHPHALQPFVIDEDRCKIVYVPYGMTISGAFHARNQQHNLWVHNRAWRIIAGSEFHKMMFEKFCDRGGSHVVALGNPKWDSTDCAPTPSQKPRFLWNIHYCGEDGIKYSTWDELGFQILSIFRALPEVTLVVRPHPAFFRHLHRKGRASAARQAIMQVPNVVLDDSPTPSAAMKSCTAMLSDGSSMIYDFAVTGKPILYLRSADCERLHEHAFGLVRRYFAVGDSVEHVRRFIDKVSREPAAGTEERCSEVGAYLRYDRRRPVGMLVRDYVLANGDRA